MSETFTFTESDSSVVSTAISAPAGTADTTEEDLFRFQATLQIYCVRLQMEGSTAPAAPILAKNSVAEADEILAALGITGTIGGVK